MSASSSHAGSRFMTFLSVFYSRLLFLSAVLFLPFLLIIFYFLFFPSTSTLSSQSGLLPHVASLLSPLLPLCPSPSPPLSHSIPFFFFSSITLPLCRAPSPAFTPPCASSSKPPPSLPPPPPSHPVSSHSPHDYQMN